MKTLKTYTAITIELMTKLVKNKSTKIENRLII
jgi:hypothetical protein